MADNQPKLKVMSFFPVQKLKGTQQWPQWNWGHDRGIYSVPGLGSEGSPTGWEMLLPLQQSKTFYLQVPISEGIKDSYPFKPKGGDGTEEGSLDHSSQGDQAKDTPGGDAQGMRHHTQTPFLNPNPFHRWYGTKNLAKVRVNSKSCMALLDNGSQINTITPNFVESCSLEVGPLSDLVGGQVTCVGLGNSLTQLIGYVIIWIQVDRVQGYDENQIALQYQTCQTL